MIERFLRKQLKNCWIKKIEDLCFERFFIMKQFWCYLTCVLFLLTACEKGEDVAVEEVERVAGIYSLADLVAFRDARNAEEDVSMWRNEQGVINLYADIDMSSIQNWMPIAVLKEGEVFQGNKHTISGLKISSISYDESGKIAATGFIDECYGDVANLHLGKGNIMIEIQDWSNVAIGGLCSRLYGEVISCSSSLNIVVTTASRYAFETTVGGLVGRCLSGKIRDSVNWGDVCCLATDNDLYTYVAGILGCFYDSECVVDACENNGKIEGANVGGIANVLDFGVNGVSVGNCLNAGRIIGKHSAGGISGISGGHYYACVNNGDVISNGWAGGICGFVPQAAVGEVVTCTNNGNIMGPNESWAGGLVGGKDTYASRIDLEDNVCNGTVNGSPGNDDNAVGSYGFNVGGLESFS